MSKKEELRIRPYARLLTMLGDQLIKDESIAIIELIKNAYDADAEHVWVSFLNFNSDYTANNKSTIVIEDDGNGMNEEIMKTSWMNPATPEKLNRKKERRTTDKGRIIQGEKGIGRFAIFKLGKSVQLISRYQKKEQGHFVGEPASDSEYILTYDFSEFNDDFLYDGQENGEVYLDDLIVGFEERKAEEIVSKEISCGGVIEHRKPFGTKIVISNLKGEWGEERLENVYQDILRLQPIFGNQFSKDFVVFLGVNGDLYISKRRNLDDIRRLLDEKSVFIVEGCFNADEKRIEFDLNNHNTTIHYSFELDSPEMIGIKPMTEYLKSLKKRKVECGSFSYKFYILDLNVSLRDKNTRYYLDPDEKKDIKAHRIYLYRDGIRVMPYGDQEDDWLLLDTIRGTESAASVMGNDQIVGYVSISQEQNPKLRDKTNREGLIEDGHAREDLVNICQLILRYLRKKQYAQYLIDKKNRKNNADGVPYSEITLTKDAQLIKLGKAITDQILAQHGQQIINTAKSNKNNDSHNSDVRIEALDGFLAKHDAARNKEREVWNSRITTTENLAAIGLSAETAYHDARILLNKTKDELSGIIKNYCSHNEEYLIREAVIKQLQPIEAQMKTVSKLMNNIQRLFPSTKTRKTTINITSIITKVKELYDGSLRKAKIDCRILTPRKGSLLVECTDAVLLQVFINLFDNSLYWLKTVGTDRSIVIKIDPISRRVVFSDSGPGVNKEDEAYIFEPFYSGKGEEGKGLGLYIARQLLERYGASIRLAKDANEKISTGATFIVQFGPFDNTEESN